MASRTQPHVFGVSNSLSGKAWTWRGGNMDIGSGGGLEERVCGSLAPVDADQEPCIEDHRPYRSAIAATVASSGGPSLAPQAVRNDRSASWR